MLAIEYVPAYIRQAAGQCTFSRAFRLHSQGRITPPIAWGWPSGPTAPSKRQAVGACPANIDALLGAQAPDEGDAEFMSFPDPTTSTVQAQPPQTQAPSTTIPSQPSTIQEPSSTMPVPTTIPSQPSTIQELSPTVPVPTTMATSVIKPSSTLCANLQFLPGGGSVGSNCNGDANLTVTFPPVRRRSFPTPAP